MIRSLLAVVLALLPGGLAWWSGRRSLALRDDPLLPERLLERTRRLTQASVLVAVIIAFFLPSQAPWALPLGALALLIGVFPARRALRDESWGLFGYLVAMGRFYLGAVGIWVLVAAAPLVVLAVEPPARWFVAAGLAALLLVWGHFYSWIFLKLVGSTPLERAELTPRLTAIAARSTIPAPEVHRFGFAGGRMANAFAFPGERRGKVLFADQVLGFFQLDEIAAIFAHELAHLEHWDRARLRRSRAAMVLVVALAVVGIPLLQLWLETLTPMIAWGWALALPLALGFRASLHQRHEAESDQRAVALCGDAEALARGLSS